ncbi:MAG: hypothetical protein KJ614_15840 [Gammaproteobacteria bacterium]|uniref:hypothetical protein n=1 Tax=Rhodoferax sp. TaxID=50421 RepID=UPI001DA90C7E|nr:hypothetical protein [Rhodoferax sp.]MBU3900366.1 hypothetical protein [Gammaproteobacteria bacterium]MBU4080943.1 hypothetical protein [Gammaproteobacteria bacterium]
MFCANNSGRATVKVPDIQGLPLISSTRALVRGRLVRTDWFPEPLWQGKSGFLFCRFFLHSDAAGTENVKNIVKNHHTIFIGMAFA